MSVRAFNAGDDRAELGERDPAMLAAERAVLRWPPSWMVIGPEADCRSCWCCPTPLPVSTMVGLLVAVAYMGRSVCSCSPAADGVRM
jgi:hypothetical protein